MVCNSQGAVLLNPALQEMVQDHLPVGIQVRHFNHMNLGPIVPAPQCHGIEVVHPESMWAAR